LCQRDAFSLADPCQYLSQHWRQFTNFRRTGA
jgi:hypothetical protein